MGEVGMAWRCLLSSRNDDEQVSACMPRQKNDGGKSGDDGGGGGGGGGSGSGGGRGRKGRAREREGPLQGRI